VRSAVRRNPQRHMGAADHKRLFRKAIAHLYPQPGPPSLTNMFKRSV
jgi:hypothetical protein